MSHTTLSQIVSVSNLKLRDHDPSFFFLKGHLVFAFEGLLRSSRRLHEQLNRKHIFLILAYSQGALERQVIKNFFVHFSYQYD